jgi:hypothetical protein
MMASVPFHWFLSPVAALVAALVLNAVFVRHITRISSLLSFLIIGSAVGVALVANGYAAQASASECLTAILVFAAGCEFILFTITLVMTSITANAIVDLVDGVVAGRPEMSAELRIVRLSDAGLIESGGQGIYRLTARGRLLRAVLGGLARILSNK